MRQVSKAIIAVQEAKGSNLKRTLLFRYAEIPGFKEILQFIYNPYVKTGIANAKLVKAMPLAVESDITWQQVIQHFTLNQTGNTSDITFAASFVSQFLKGSEEREVAKGMVTKNLKIGVTATTLNKVYGDAFIPTVGVMKAETYDDFKGKVKGPFIATEKLDGARRLIRKENGKVTIRTRSGIVDTGLIEIEVESDHLPDNCVYDGELLAIGEFENALELRQATNAIANQKGEKRGLTFNMFDMVPVADYDKGKSIHTAINRKLMVAAMFGDESIECLVPGTYKQLIADNKLDFDFKFIRSVPIEGVVNTEEEIMKMAAPIWRRGFEGLMLNTYNGLYDVIKDRSRDILKVKCVEEYTLRVIDVEAGKPGHKYENTLGSLILDYKGNRVGAGSGLSDAQRQAWWADPSKILGRAVEIECFGESSNKQGGISLNCAIFKRVAGQE